MASTTSSNHAHAHAHRWTAFGAALLLWAAPASAQPRSASDLATARELYLEAKALRASGDASAALQKYRGAWASAPTPIIGVELGRTHMQLGQLIEARETFLAAARLQVEHDETPRSAQARQEATTLAEELRPKIPTLIVKVNGAPESSPATLTIDGANVTLVGSGATRKINPGNHELVARLGSSEKRESVELSEGETKQLTLDLGISDSDVARAPAREEGHSEGPLRPALVYGGFGLAGAGAVVGTVAGILALGKASSVDAACRDRICPESARSDVDTGRTMATVSTIGFAAVAVGAGLGMIGLLVVRPAPPTPRATLERMMPQAAILAGGALLGAEGTF